MSAPPVYLEGAGAILPDGTHVPEAAIQRAVDTVMALCAWIETLPVEERMRLSLEQAFAELDMP